MSEPGGGVSEFWQQKYRREAAKNWNLFYKRNETRFFKDRHWIGREFPELYQPSTKVRVPREGHPAARQLTPPAGLLVGGS